MKNESVFMQLKVEPSANQKFAKVTAIVWTILYCFAFPFLLMKALSSGSMLTNPTVTFASGMTIICMDYAAAFVIPLGLYLMWSSYKQGNYERCHFFGVMPLIFFITYIFLRIAFLDLFLNQVVHDAAP